MSTLHMDKDIDPESGEQKKPSVITFYNQTKGGVDTEVRCVLHTMLVEIQSDGPW